MKLSVMDTLIDALMDAGLRSKFFEQNNCTSVSSRETKGLPCTFRRRFQVCYVHNGYVHYSKKVYIENLVVNSI